MADINLDFLSPEKREFLRRRAEERGSTVEEELERALGEAMEAAEAEEEQEGAGDHTQRPPRPIDEFESCHTPETLAEARRRDRELTRKMKKLVGGDEREGGMMSIAGIIEGESGVTSENIDDFLYGNWEEDQ